MCNARQVSRYCSPNKTSPHAFIMEYKRSVNDLNMTLSVHVCKWEDKLACEARQKKKKRQKKQTKQKNNSGYQHSGKYD